MRLVIVKKSGDPAMTRHSALMPRLFISSVSEESISATPPP